MEWNVLIVKVVQLRNEVIESLEMDRIREAEEDQVSFIDGLSER